MAKNYASMKDPNWEDIGNVFADRIEKNQFISRKRWNRKNFMEWFLFRVNLLGLRFDWQLIARAYSVSRELELKNDHFTVFVGPEGVGKTTIALQWCAWVTPTFKLSDVAFDMPDYVRRLKQHSEGCLDKSKERQYKSIQIDEGGISLFSREAMSKSNTTLAKTFMVQRFLNINVAICIPFYWVLDTMIRQHRIKTLIIVTERGKYKAVVGKGIKRLNLTGQSNRHIPLSSIAIPYGTFWKGHFSKLFPNTLSNDEYDKYKFKHIEKFIDTTNQEEVVNKMRKVAVAHKELGINRRTLVEMVKRGEVEGRKIGLCWFITDKAYKNLSMEGGVSKTTPSPSSSI